MINPPNILILKSRFDANDISNFNNFDIICFEGAKLAADIIKEYSLKEKKLVIFHQNQNDLLAANWKELGICQHVVITKKAQNILVSAGYNDVKIIQPGIDLEFFIFRDQLSEEKTFGYVGGITPEKRFADIACAAREIGFPLKVMSLEDESKFAELPKDDGANIDLEFLNCTDGTRREAYSTMRVCINFTDDGFGEKSLSLIEAMASGVPVITTSAGLAADICVNEYNSLIVPFGDFIALKSAMRRLIYDTELCEKLRKNAWETVKNLNKNKNEIENRRILKKIHYGLLPLVSVIIPYTQERQSVVDKILDAYRAQTYPNIELKPIVDMTGKYSLALIRNQAAIESDGEILIFNDSRIVPENDAVEKFVRRILVDEKVDLNSPKRLNNSKLWFFGNKGCEKKDFVENFSAITRENYLRAGGCNLMIDRYGGMSQELRERFGWIGFTFIFCQEAKAKPIISSHKNASRRADIIASKFKLWQMGFIKK